jgi:two-component system nitrogen regulation response regulator GlnG
MVSDDSTLTLGPLDTLTGSGRGPPLVPALTIIWHPDLDRAGQVAPLTALFDSAVAHLSRDEPIFFPPGSGTGQSVDHRRMSREPVIDVVSARGILELHPGRSGGEIEVDGLPFNEAKRLTADDLRRGLILTVARRFVFCLHSIHFPITRSPTLGLLGTSDGIEEVRRSITRVADKKTPVLLRGESGTGKELAARALHDAGPRPSSPFVAVNMGRLLRETAAADLFGYQKGAFTGATADSPGHFRSASGGTIFLDEIGFTPPDVQPMLLRVLEDHVVQALGASQPRKVDVRIVAATDARLEKAVAAGRFEPSLFNRLNNSFNIPLPPLRDRREDVGTLLVQFLRSEFADSTQLQRLQDPEPQMRPWLSARDVAAVALSPLSGNVRSLIGLARDLVTKAGDDPRADTHSVIKAFLSRNLADTQMPDPGRSPTPTASGQSVPTGAELLSALESADWNRPRAAKVLGVSRQAFWRYLVKHADLRLVADLDPRDLLRESEACGGDLQALAKKLGVSAPLLSRRLLQRL